jgi:superfamily II DNA or RNA helicase
MKCTIRITDEVWCIIANITPEHNQALYNKFGIFVDGYFFMPAYKMGRWDGKIRFYQQSGKTYVRLLDEIVPLLDSWEYEIELIDERKQVKHPIVPGEVTKRDEDGFAIEATGLDLLGDIELPNGAKFLLRPYQFDCIKTAVEEGNGILIAGTGAGKTSITGGLSFVYGNAGHSVITIVPSSDLVDQTAEWYRLLGLDVGIYSGNSKDIDHTHVVATWQALQHNKDILKNFTVVIYDECHGVRASVAQELLNDYGAHIVHRFGVTGTLPKSEIDQLSIKVSVGSVLIEIPASWLIKNGYLAKIDILPVEINETYVTEGFSDYDAERAFLAKSPARLEKIADLIISLCAQHGNTFVLVNSIPFGKKLSALIKDSVFLYGTSPKDLRKEHYQMFDERNDMIVIASSGIASTGISIDRIFCEVLVDPGKSFIKAIQSVGRGLRKGVDKDSVLVVDVHSKLKWARKHFKDRAKYYKEAGYPMQQKVVLKVIKE